ncbi:MAG TPA: FliH/SctL family protein [Anaerolineae bacterium]|nr:FliH/SctL family protein [Anaerolineae bacterium]
MSKISRKLLRNLATPAQPRLLHLPTRPSVRPERHKAGVAELPTMDAMPQALSADLLREQTLAHAQREGYEAGMARALKEAQPRIEDRVQAATAERIAQMERETLAQLQKRQRELEASWVERMEALESLLKRVPMALAARLDALEPQVVELALEFACRLLGPDGDRRGLVEAWVSQALSRLRGEPTRICLHPQDLALIHESEWARSLIRQFPGLEWAADTSLDAGGCVVDSESGSLEARLDQQVGRLLDAWRKVLTVSEGKA